jgi:peroxiredoxin
VDLAITFLLRRRFLSKLIMAIYKNGCEFNYLWFMKILVMLTCLLLGVNSLYGQAYKDSALVKLNKIPTFKSLKLDSTNTNLQKLMKKGVPNVVLFFSPDCDHCQEEIKSIVANMDSVKNINFILVSNRLPSAIKQFAKEYKLLRYKNFNYICDVGNNLTRYYGLSSNPSMFIYNKDLKCTAGYNSSMVPIKVLLSKARM